MEGAGPLAVAGDLRLELVEAGEATSYSSEPEEKPAGESGGDSGSLASDEALQALREKLTGGQE